MVGVKFKTVSILKLTRRTQAARILRVNHNKYLSQIGRLGGQAKSARKAQAARINGAKGGRPRIRTSTDKISVASQAARV